MCKSKLLFYFGHHKCASTWISGIIRQTCYRVGIQFVDVNFGHFLDKYLASGLRPGFISYSPEYLHKILSLVFKNIYLRKSSVTFIAYKNADFRYLSKLDNFKGFHVIRDPRDIVVSSYFSHLYSHPTKGWSSLIKHREKLRKVSKEEGLLIQMKYPLIKSVFMHLSTWNYSQQNVLEIKMEDLVQTPYETFLSLFGFLGLVNETNHSMIVRTVAPLATAVNKINGKTRGLFPFYYNLKTILGEELLRIIYRNRFVAKTKGRQIGEEDIKHHYRKGISGDWVNHFNSEHKKYFKERYNNLLLKLGYESGITW